MQRLVISMIVAVLCAAGMAVAQTPAVEKMSDAEIYVKVRLEELQKEQTNAIAVARADIERDVNLKFLAELGDLKRQLIEERAKTADLQRKLDDLAPLVKSITPPAPVPVPATSAPASAASTSAPAPAPAAPAK